MRRSIWRAERHSAAAILREEIARTGPISFARFMQIALYRPQLGYYRSDRFGKEGDFFTAGQLPVFAELLRSFVGERRLLEIGAGRRELAAAFSPRQYVGIDIDAPALPETFQGVVLANEFFDALPVRAMRRTDSGWEEMLVAWDREFVWTHGPADAELSAYANKYGGELPAGGILEYNSRLEEYVLAVERVLTRGVFLILDYGYTRSEIPRFPAGSLMSYRKHVAMEDVLSDPGAQDITAHVNFDALQEAAVGSGFRVESETTMRDWLLRIWSEERLQAWWDGADVKSRMQWKRLAFGMGENFRALVLSKT